MEITPDMTDSFVAKKISDSITDENGIANMVLKEIPLCWYTLEGDIHFGCIAQELEQFAPEAVEQYFNIKKVNYERLVPALIATIRILNNKIIELENRPAQVKEIIKEIGEKDSLDKITRLLGERLQRMERRPETVKVVERTEIINYLPALRQLEDKIKELPSGNNVIVKETNELELKERVQDIIADLEAKVISLNKRQMEFLENLKDYSDKLKTKVARNTKWVDKSGWKEEQPTHKPDWSKEQ